jgi:hypothetical protein
MYLTCSPDSLDIRFPGKEPQPSNEPISRTTSSETLSSALPRQAVLHSANGREIVSILSALADDSEYQPATASFNILPPSKLHGELYLEGHALAEAFRYATVISHDALRTLQVNKDSDLFASISFDDLITYSQQKIEREADIYLDPSLPVQRAAIRYEQYMTDYEKENRTIETYLPLFRVFYPTIDIREKLNDLITKIHDSRIFHNALMAPGQVKFINNEWACDDETRFRFTMIPSILMTLERENSPYSYIIEYPLFPNAIEQDFIFKPRNEAWLANRELLCPDFEEFGDDPDVAVRIRPAKHPQTVPEYWVNDLDSAGEQHLLNAHLNNPVHD